MEGRTLDIKLFSLFIICTRTCISFTFLLILLYVIDELSQTEVFKEMFDVHDVTTFLNFSFTPLQNKGCKCFAN